MHVAKVDILKCSLWNSLSYGQNIAHFCSKRNVTEGAGCRFVTKRYDGGGGSKMGGGCLHFEVPMPQFER